MSLLRYFVMLTLALSATVCASQTPKPSTYRWTKFTTVQGQPDPVPIEWVSTPEGAFAHSIVVPKPVPKDSGHRPGMTADEYFEHLCKTQAGEFIYKTVDNVEGFYFMRPPNRPAYKDLMDRFKLEDPYTERSYQLTIDGLPYRPAEFVNPPFSLYKYVEEPRRLVAWQAHINTQFVKFSGYRQSPARPMKIEEITSISSKYGYIWRGVRRSEDRQNRIAGSELIVIDTHSLEVVGVLRNFAMSPKMRDTPDGIWWLNAITCSQFEYDYRDNLGKQIYGFIKKVLRPMQEDDMGSK